MQKAKIERSNSKPGQMRPLARDSSHLGEKTPKINQLLRPKAMEANPEKQQAEVGGSGP